MTDNDFVADRNAGVRILVEFQADPSAMSEEIRHLRHALRDLALWGNCEGGDCWCRDKERGLKSHSPGCTAARWALNGIKP